MQQRREVRGDVGQVVAVREEVVEHGERRGIVGARVVRLEHLAELAQLVGRARLAKVVLRRRGELGREERGAALRAPVARRAARVVQLLREVAQQRPDDVRPQHQLPRFAPAFVGQVHVVGNRQRAHASEHDVQQQDDVAARPAKLARQRRDIAREPGEAVGAQGRRLLRTEPRARRHPQVHDRAQQRELDRAHLAHDRVLCLAVVVTLEDVAATRRVDIGRALGRRVHEPVRHAADLRTAAGTLADRIGPAAVADHVRVAAAALVHDPVRRARERVEERAAQQRRDQVLGHRRHKHVARAVWPVKERPQACDQVPWLRGVEQRRAEPGVGHERANVVALERGRERHPVQLVVQLARDQLQQHAAERSRLQHGQLLREQRAQRDHRCAVARHLLQEDLARERKAGGERVGPRSTGGQRAQHVLAHRVARVGLVVPRGHLHRDVHAHARVRAQRQGEAVAALALGHLVGVQPRHDVLVGRAGHECLD
eukprot:Unigene9273_Nuclearia_a/m.28320 Unigene9273_Nuclearia_a/g.28320  ORF Unigene9273_Nuclearia_a/g.28320 Unigene9273_Nuclearia_a/m.28320 type:complete len:486 (+) Unigene9273_Nuclearia_a:1076-2533(+)